MKAKDYFKKNKVKLTKEQRDVIEIWASITSIKIELATIEKAIEKLITCHEKTN